MTPKMPTAVSSSASPANAESSHAATRVRHIASPTRSSIVLTDRSGRFGSRARTSRLIAAVRPRAPSWPRTTICMFPRYDCARGRNTCGVGSRFECPVAHVADDADDLGAVLESALSDRNPFADRRLARPVGACRRFVDQRDLGLADPIAIREVPAFKNGDLAARRSNPPSPRRRPRAAAVSPRGCGGNQINVPLQPPETGMQKPQPADSTPGSARTRSRSACRRVARFARRNGRTANRTAR